MAQLAIKGHATRGEEVIKILEMLGGIGGNYKADFTSLLFFIGRANYITYDDIENNSNYAVFNLEEFLEKFPYKVGDKVLARGSAGKITDMKWQGDSFFTIKEEGEVVYTVMLDTEEEITFIVEDLQPYKEETMEEIIKIDIPKGYEFAEVDNNTQQVVFTKIQSEYPKTYEECCKLLDICPKGSIVYAGNWVYGGDYLEKHLEKIKNFQKLLICRNAYWKIYGEQMGLGKPWEPNWKDNNDKYFICYLKDELWTSNIRDCNRFLVFPTEEMRDAFFLDSEEIAQLISSCKEFL